MTKRLLNEKLMKAGKNAKDEEAGIHLPNPIKRQSFASVAKHVTLGKNQVQW